MAEADASATRMSQKQNQKKKRNNGEATLPHGLPLRGRGARRTERAESTNNPLSLPPTSPPPAGRRRCARRMVPSSSPSSRPLVSGAAKKTQNSPPRENKTQRRRDEGMSVWTWGRPRNVTVKKPERSEKADRRIGRMFPAWNDKGSTAESQSAKAARLAQKQKSHCRTLFYGSFEASCGEHDAGGRRRRRARGMTACLARKPRDQQPHPRCGPPPSNNQTQRLPRIERKQRDLFGSCGLGRQR